MDRRETAHVYVIYVTRICTDKPDGSSDVFRKIVSVESERRS